MHDPERKYTTVAESLPTQFLYMGAIGVSPDALTLPQNDTIRLVSIHKYRSRCWCMAMPFNNI